MNTPEKTFAEMTPAERQLFLAGMRQLAFIAASAWQHIRQEPSALAALDQLNALVVTFDEEQAL